MIRNSIYALKTVVSCSKKTTENGIGLLSLKFLREIYWLHPAWRKCWKKRNS